MTDLDFDFLLDSDRSADAFLDRFLHGNIDPAADRVFLGRGLRDALPVVHFAGHFFFNKFADFAFAFAFDFFQHAHFVLVLFFFGDKLADLTLFGLLLPLRRADFVLVLFFFRDPLALLDCAGLCHGLADRDGAFAFFFNLLPLVAGVLDVFLDDLRNPDALSTPDFALRLTRHARSGLAAGHRTRLAATRDFDFLFFPVAVVFADRASLLDRDALPDPDLFFLRFLVGNVDDVFLVDFLPDRLTDFASPGFFLNVRSAHKVGVVDLFPVLFPDRPCALLRFFVRNTLGPGVVDLFPGRLADRADDVARLFDSLPGGHFPSFLFFLLLQLADCDFPFFDFPLPLNAFDGFLFGFPFRNQDGAFNFFPGRRARRRCTTRLALLAGLTLAKPEGGNGCKGKQQVLHGAIPFSGRKNFVDRNPEILVSFNSRQRRLPPLSICRYGSATCRGRQTRHSEPHQGRHPLRTIVSNRMPPGPAGRGEATFPARSLGGDSQLFRVKCELSE